jgi:hypothetical protein
MLVQNPSASVERRAQEMPAGSALASTRDRIEACPVGELLIEDVRPELGRQLAVALSPAHHVDPLSAEGERDRDRVERNRPGSHRDQHGRTRSLGERGSHTAPGIGNVVREAGDHGRSDPVGNRDEHRVGVRDPDRVACEAAVVNPDRQAVGREARHRVAIAALPGPAAGALTAGDLERNADQIAGLDRLHLVAHVGHLSHAFVPEGK